MARDSPNFFAGPYIDRRAEERDNPEWLAAARADPATTAVRSRGRAAAHRGPRPCPFARLGARRPGRAQRARSTRRPYCGAVGTLDRFGARRSLALHYAAGIIFIALISLFALPYLPLLAVVFLAGVTVLGSQTGLNGACGKLYPARMRTSGYGLATGVGRLGGIAAAPLGGYLLARGLPPTYVFLSACLFAAIAAVATAFLALPGRRPTSHIAVVEMAS